MRIFLYSHDTYGLGHIRRTLTIAQHLAQAVPHASQLLVTGSMQSHCFDLPQRLDYIKLPGVSKRSSGEYCSRVLALPCDTTMALRENIIFNAVQHFNPDVVLVDKAPAGVKGEMLRSLRYLNDPLRLHPTIGADTPSHQVRRDLSMQADRLVVITAGGGGVRAQAAVAI